MLGRLKKMLMMRISVLMVHRMKVKVKEARLRHLGGSIGRSHMHNKEVIMMLNTLKR